MKKSYIVLFLISFIFSCADQSSDNKKNITNNEGSQMQSEILDTCFCSELDRDSLGTHYLKEKLYTGICIEYYPETSTKYMEKSILSGLLHGKSSFFDKSGEMLVEEIYENGKKKRSGEVMPLTCDCSELVKSEKISADGKTHYFLDDIPYTGTCEKYYPDSSSIYMEINYKNGLLEGRSTFYNKDGSKMYTEKYEAGELITTYY